jgi:K+-transporting ATPase ATPase C chain
VKELRANLRLLLLTLVVGCVAYPLVLHAVGRGLFPTPAAGSLVAESAADGTGAVRGSRLVAQPFTDDAYFWPRPSAGLSRRTRRC